MSTPTPHLYFILIRLFSAGRAAPRAEATQAIVCPPQADRHNRILGGQLTRTSWHVSHACCTVRAPLSGRQRQSTARRRRLTVWALGAAAPKKPSDRRLAVDFERPKNSKILILNAENDQEVTVTPIGMLDEFGSSSKNPARTQRNLTRSRPGEATTHVKTLCVYPIHSTQRRTHTSTHGAPRSRGRQIGVSCVASSPGKRSALRWRQTTCCRCWQ